MEDIFEPSGVLGGLRQLVEGSARSNMTDPDFYQYLAQLMTLPAVQECTATVARRKHDQTCIDVKEVKLPLDGTSLAVQTLIDLTSDVEDGGSGEDDQKKVCGCSRLCLSNLKA